MATPGLDVDMNNCVVVVFVSLMGDDDLPRAVNQGDDVVVRNDGLDEKDLAAAWTLGVLGERSNRR